MSVVSGADIATCCCPILHCVFQAKVCGPTIAYVDDAEAMAAQLKELLPSLQHVLADVLHVMKRVCETLKSHHHKIGKFIAHHCSSDASWPARKKPPLSLTATASCWCLFCSSSVTCSKQQL